MSHVAETAQSTPSTTPASPLSLSWVKRLVSIDTVSRNPNLGLIEMVRDDLRAQGIEATLTHDDSGKWANLFATVPAHDGETNGGIVLSGHTDVVPVDGQQWDSDPFKPEIRDDRLYGRGTCDMKGFIGAALTLLPHMQNTKLAKPIHFALSFDEEVGCVGAPLHRRRADQHAADHRAQGHQRVSVLRARPGRAFVADAEGSQRDRIRRAPHLLHPRHGRPVPR
jgi:acetylornithine deacetylase